MMPSLQITYTCIYSFILNIYLSKYLSAFNNGFNLKYAIEKKEVCVIVKIVDGLSIY